MIPTKRKKRKRKREMHPSTLAYSFSSVLVVCGCRYRAPLKPDLLTFVCRRLYSRHRPLPLFSSRRRLSSTSFFTGKSLFTRMEQFTARGDSTKCKAMLEKLQYQGIVTLPKVVEVMETIDRALFVPDGASPYVDSPMQIGYNATISAPHMHGMCLEMLEKHLKPGMHALDVGSGTGYLTACFATMVGPQGRVVGVEHIPELAAESVKNIQKSAAAALLKDGSLSIHTGDGRLGWPEHAPYDAIHVGAAAPEIPQALIEQLKPGGMMVIPVGDKYHQELMVVEKKMDGSVSTWRRTSVRYVPLTSQELQLHGEAGC